MKKLHTIKVDDGDWKAWKSSAVSEGVSLSVWIRKRCSEPFLIAEATPIEPWTPRENPNTIPVRKPCKHGLLFCKKCK